MGWGSRTNKKIFKTLIEPKGKKFKNFLKLNLWKEALTDHRRKSLPVNEHWMNFWELCFPCDIEYDFILKLESISEESEWLLSHLNITEVKYPKGYKHSGMG